MNPTGSAEGRRCSHSTLAECHLAPGSNKDGRCSCQTRSCADHVSALCDEQPRPSFLCLCWKAGHVHTFKCVDVCVKVCVSACVHDSTSPAHN